MKIAIQLVVAGIVFDGVFLCCFFPRDGLDEILDLIESVSKVFISTLINKSNIVTN